KLLSYKDSYYQKLESQRKYVVETVGEKESQIVQAHMEILDDPELFDSIKKKIEKEHMNLVMAIDETRKFFLSLFAGIDDPYIRERSKDIDDVTSGWMKVALGIVDHQLSQIKKSTIIFAKDLNPSDTMQLNESIEGIVLQEGSLTSHTAIVAKAKGIPTIVAYDGELPKEDDLVILDSHTTQIFYQPEELLLREYRKKQQMESEKHQELKKIRDKQAITLDGHHIEIVGNVGSAMETEAMIKNGGFGVGLLRTEFVYMNSSHWPTEEEQYKEYLDIAKKANGEVIIRTLDIGGDKMLPYYEFHKEENPFLGLRAIRFCLKNPGIFKTQLKAILRVSAKYPVKIMFPMISHLEELRQAKEILEEVKLELRKEAMDFNEKIPVGIMVEIPSVVYVMDLFAKEVDFVSIGTNDLCQYTLAVDRLNPEVSYIYDGMNISILRMIAQVVKACHYERVKVGVCGELAGDVNSALVLVGLGVDELSMSPSMIPTVKENILKSYYSDLQVKSKERIEC
ncbi:MAG: phosphoenolpyruvate--protein phosphotransferase, partial [Vallitaleaceae bacterium]|nr:phosphoenolpyruvate--protein phosphotransferase [Vallitaleaceae bacterium]